MNKLLLTTAGLATFSSTALAAGGAHHGPVEVPWESIGYHALNLFLLLAIIGYFGGRAMKAAAKTRAANIANHLEASNEMRKEAQDRYRELEARLQHMESEVGALKDEAREAASREAKLIEEQTEADIARIKASSALAIQNELTSARVALHAEAVELATELARKQLESSVTDSAHQEMTRQFLGDVGKEAN